MSASFIGLHMFVVGLLGGGAVGYRYADPGYYGVGVVGTALLGVALYLDMFGLLGPGNYLPMAVLLFLSWTALGVPLGSWMTRMGLLGRSVR